MIVNSSKNEWKKSCPDTGSVGVKKLGETTFTDVL